MKALLKTTILAAAAILVTAGFGVAEASAQGVTEEVLSRMNAHNKTLKSLKANVTMVKLNEQLGGVTDTTEGVVSYLPQANRNPYIRIDWKRPEESMAVINNDYVLFRPSLKQAYTGNINKASGNAKAGGALAFMSMSRAQLKANYDITNLGEATVKGGISTIHLKMTPKTRTNYKDAEIWVDGNGMPVQSKVTEHNGDSTTVYLYDLKKNVTINASEFEIKLPKGTKILKS